MRISLLATLAIAVVLVSTTGADAAHVPPGNSAATQYAETVPSAGGEEAHRHREKPDQSSSSQGDEKGTAISAETAGEFTELGPEGEAALRLADEGGPEGHAEKHHAGKHHAGKSGSHKKKSGEEKSGEGHQGDGGSSGSGDSSSGSGPASAQGSPSGSGSSGLGEVLGGVVGTSGGGPGFVGPLILAAIVLAAAAFVLRRRGGGTHDPA
ncbi:MAG TPA: hypothetical protein VHZ54_13855 [Solirubrobacterales bacterium]|nr:hypothetical protein [Solirubrobacterales bacterium]